MHDQYKAKSHRNNRDILITTKQWLPVWGAHNSCIVNLFVVLTRCDNVRLCINTLNTHTCYGVITWVLIITVQYCTMHNCGYYTTYNQIQRKPQNNNAHPCNRRIVNFSFQVWIKRTRAPSSTPRQPIMVAGNSTRKSIPHFRNTTSVGYGWTTNRIQPWVNVTADHVSYQQQRNTTARGALLCSCTCSSFFWHNIRQPLYTQHATLRWWFKLPTANLSLCTGEVDVIAEIREGNL